jgi:hypothetical protein
MKPAGKLFTVGGVLRPKKRKPIAPIGELSAARARIKRPVPGLIPIEKAPRGIQIGAATLALNAAQERLVTKYGFPSRVAQTNPNVKRLVTATTNISQAITLIGEQERRALKADELRKLRELKLAIGKERGIHKALGINDRYIRLLLK